MSNISPSLLNQEMKNDSVRGDLFIPHLIVWLPTRIPFVTCKNGRLATQPGNQGKPSEFRFAVKNQENMELNRNLENRILCINFFLLFQIVAKSLLQGIF